MQKFAVLLAGAVIFSAAPAMPSPLDPMAKAFANVKSVHADIKTSHGTVGIDMIMPDRFHETMYNGMQVIMIGSDMWMNQGGKWTKMPFTIPQMRTMVDMAKNNGAASHPSDYTLTFLGPAVVNGVPSKHYRLVPKSNAQPLEMWVGANNLPVQVETPGKDGPIYILYSQYNAVPAITPPM